MGSVISILLLTLKIKSIVEFSIVIGQHDDRAFNHTPLQTHYSFLRTTEGQFVNSSKYTFALRNICVEHPPGGFLATHQSDY